MLAARTESGEVRGLRAAKGSVVSVATSLRACTRRRSHRLVRVLALAVLAAGVLAGVAGFAGASSAASRHLRPSAYLDRLLSGVNASRLSSATVTGTITPGGASVQVSITTAGDDASLTFSGTAGERVSANFTNSSFSGCCSVQASIVDPSGSTVGGTLLFGSSGGFLDARTLPASGTYTIRIVPQNRATGSVTVTLYDVPADSTASVTPTSGSGASVALTPTSTPGQNLSVTFSGSAGQRIAAQLSNITVPGCCSVAVTLKGPDGSSLNTIPVLMGTAANWFDTRTLPTSGTYTLFLDPDKSATGGATVTVYDVPADSTASVTPTSGSGASVALTPTSTPGQNLSVTFSGSAGQRIAAQLSNITVPGCCSVAVTLKGTDGSSLNTIPVLMGTAANWFDTRTLPTSGTYTLFLDPDKSATGGATVTVYDVPADPSPQLVIGGASTQVTVDTPGQNARPTFVGKTGQPVTATLSGVTLPGCCTVQLSILKPDGSTLGNSVLMGSGGGSTGQRTLPSDGTYTVLINAQKAAIGSATVTVSQSAPYQPLPQTYGTCSGYGINALAPSACTADPVNSLTGAFTDSFTDVSVPSPGVSFAFTRSYTSADATVGRLGPGWSDTYSAAVTVQQNGDVLVSGEDGQQLSYVQQADETYVPPAGALSSLTAVPGGYELVRHDQSRYNFDSAGRLTGVVDANGEGVALAYDVGGHLDTVTDSVGRVETFASNPDGTLQSITLSDGRTVSFGYTDGRLTSVTGVDGKTSSYSYDGGGRLATIVDPLGHTVVTNVYDADGRVSQQTDGNGKTTTFAWDAATQTATITDPNGHVWKDVYANNVLVEQIDPDGHTTTFGHDGDLNTSSVAAPDGSQTAMSHDANGNLLTATAPASLGNARKTFTYDGDNNVKTVTDAAGHVTSYVYDASGNPTSVSLDGQLVSSFSYNGAGQVLTSSDGNNHTTTYTYDVNGNLASVTDPLGNKTTYSYDAAGNRLSMVEPLGNIAGGVPADYRTSYSYDDAGRLLTETDPLGHTTTNSYDDAGNLVSSTDANGHTTSYAYDNANHLLSVTGPDLDGAGPETAPVTSYSYDDAGNKLSETDPLGHTTSYGYDASNRVASVTTASGNKTSYSYDANGNLASVVDPRGNVAGADPADYTTSYSYDAAGRLLTEIDPLGHTTAHVYDAVGNQTSLTDANSHTTGYSYDGAGRVLTVTAADGGVTSYSYDTAGNALTRTDANNHQTSYSYDDANRLIRITGPDPDGPGPEGPPVTSYSYDENGNLVATTDPNGNATQTTGDGTTTRSFDHANRLTGIDYSDTTPDVSFSYDPAGNRTGMSDGAASVSYAYDALNRLTSISRGSDVFAYGYDAAGNPTSRSYPGGLTTSYAYTPENLLATATTGGNTTSYSYDEAGNLTQTTLPAGNGYSETRSYDRAGRLVEVKNANASSTLSDFVSTLDPVGNPTQIDRTGTVTSTTTYGYDAADRLTSVCFQASCPNGSDPQIGWSYDQVGNRLTETRDGVTTTYSYNAADELTQAGTTSYSYDANGNQLTAGSDSYSYDLASRLITADVGGTATAYSYDGDGNRLTATTGSSTTEYLWDTNALDGLPQLALERDGTGATIRGYTYGLRRIAMISAGNSHYYHYDPLGSVANLTSNSGTTEWTYEYEPFGAVKTATQNDPNAPENPMRFAGELSDSTELIYLRARQYDTASGRMLSVDPMPTAHGAAYVSPYVYAGNQPTVMVDPSGETFVSSQAAVRATAAAASRFFGATSANTWSSRQLLSGGNPGERSPYENVKSGVGRMLRGLTRAGRAMNSLYHIWEFPNEFKGQPLESVEYQLDTWASAAGWKQAETSGAGKMYWKGQRQIRLMRGHEKAPDAMHRNPRLITELRTDQGNIKTNVIQLQQVRP